MPIDFAEADISELREAKMKDVLSKLKTASTDAVKLSIIRQAIHEVRDALSKVVISKVEGKVSLADMEKIQGFVETELKRVFSPVLSLLKELKVSNQQMETIRSELDSKINSAFTSSFETMLIPKPQHSFRVENLHEIAYPDVMRIGNLGELQTYFDSLGRVIKDNFNIEIPAPKVTIQAPAQKAPIVKVDPPDLSELLKALKPLDRITGNAKKPISVRLSDGQNWISQIVRVLNKQAKQVGQYVQAGMSAGDFKDAFKTVTKARSVTSGSKALTDAASAVQIVTSKTPIDWVEFTANGKQIAIGDSSCQVTTPKGVILTPGGSSQHRVEIDDLSLMYAAGATGATLTYNYYKR
jgi:hypothetical protein